MALLHCVNGVDPNELMGFDIPKGSYLNCIQADSGKGTVQTLPANGQIPWGNNKVGAVIVHCNGYTSFNSGGPLGGIGIKPDGTIVALGPTSGTSGVTNDITGCEWLVVGGWNTVATMTIT